ncbi:hypothetical protein MMC11_001595 [Xylographa trunciseda]|nr:hypothetical protein [Xylographa trunciseda]
MENSTPTSTPPQYNLLNEETQNNWFWSSPRDNSNDDNSRGPASPTISCLNTAREPILPSAPTPSCSRAEGLQRILSPTSGSLLNIGAQDKVPSCFSISSYKHGVNNSSPPFGHFAGSTREYNSSSSAPVPCYSSYKPSHSSPLKRKRGLDRISSTVKNVNFSVYISDRNGDFELDEEDTELPPVKKSKMHHMIRIITGSGEVEYHARVCQLHNGLDISLPVRDCQDCFRVDGILDLYLSRYQRFRCAIRKANEVFSRNSRRAWDKSRLAFANYKFEVDKATVQVPASPPSRQRSSTNTLPRRKASVQIALSALTDSSQYRRDIAYRRSLPSYTPGKHTDTSGNGLLNTCNPRKQKLEEWQSPPLLPPRRVPTAARSCLKRCSDSRCEPYLLPAGPLHPIAGPLRELKSDGLWSNYLDENDDPATGPIRSSREGTPFMLTRKTLRQHEQPDHEDEAERKRNLAQDACAKVSEWTQANLSLQEAPVKRCSHSQRDRMSKSPPQQP